MRFAHLTLNGEAVLVDPALVGAVMRERVPGVPASQRKTLVFPRDDASTAFVYCDEDPAEAGRRIMAASGGATTDEVEEAMKEFTMSVAGTIASMRSMQWTATSQQQIERALHEAFYLAFAKLKDTVLKAARVAEGKE